MVHPSPAPLQEWGRRDPGSTGGSDADVDTELDGLDSLDGSVLAVACGGSNSFMLTGAGEVFMFGSLRPAADPGGVRCIWCPKGSAARRVVRVAAGWRHCLMLTEAGSAFALGDDEYGQCAGSADARTPLPMPSLQAVVGIAAGACHSVAWDRQGACFTWGHGGNGRLGLGGSGAGGGAPHCRVLARVDALKDPVCMAACGANFTLLVTDSGRALWACGGNQYGLRRKSRTRPPPSACQRIRCNDESHNHFIGAHVRAARVWPGSSLHPSGQLGLGAMDLSARSEPARVDLPRKGEARCLLSKPEPTEGGLQKLPLQ